MSTLVNLKLKERTKVQCKVFHGEKKRFANEQCKNRDSVVKVTNATRGLCSSAAAAASCSQISSKPA